MNLYTLPQIPRAGVDPIDGSGPAIAVLQLAITVPLRPETIVLVLDRRHRGRGLVVVNGTTEPDQVVDVLDKLSEARRVNPDVAAVVIASVRPGTPGCDECHHLPGDIDRWLELSDRAERAGVELIEWYLVGEGGSVSCPRDLWGEPPRW